MVFTIVVWISWLVSQVTAHNSWGLVFARDTKTRPPSLLGRRVGRSSRAVMVQVRSPQVSWQCRNPVGGHKVPLRRGGNARRRGERLREGRRRRTHPRTHAQVPGATGVLSSPCDAPLRSWLARQPQLSRGVWSRLTVALSLWEAASQSCERFLELGLKGPPAFPPFLLTRPYLHVRTSFPTPRSGCREAPWCPVSLRTPPPWLLVLLRWPLRMLDHKGLETKWCYSSLQLLRPAERRPSKNNNNKNKFLNKWSE